ncbi:MASE1 domain-containing protein [Wenzhouxiangella limi]|uniref:MASE1 domain-containing protein n=1 Tax=Wenzhouxiangella limi TaxID=2707351 RepID=A0A845VHN3_9GAMM|nr:MASE1 domain-containing protein [Wenzhouxiangella limi]NDY96699.1 hypothetical protein [Wenzhouxiangella limi]
MGTKAPLQLLIFGSWLVAFGAAALLEYAPNASLWFPPAAVTFAAVMVLGLRALPVLWLGCLVVTLLADQIYQRGLAWPELLLAGLAFAITHTLAYAAVALVLRSRDDVLSPGAYRGNVTLFLMGGMLATGLSSALGGLSLAATGMTEFRELPALIPTWWIGDYAGLVTVAPLFAVLLTQLAEALEVTPRKRLEPLLGPRPWHALWPGAALKLLGLAALTLTILAIAVVFAAPFVLVLLLLACLPVQLWIARNESPLVTLLGVFGFTLLLAIATSATGLREQAPTLQFMVISVAIGSYLDLAADRRTERDTARP